MKNPINRIAVVTVVGLCLGLAGPAWADNHSTGTSTAWEAPGTWTSGLAPTAADSVWLDHAGNYTITFNDASALSGCTNVSTLLIGGSGLPVLSVNFTNTTKVLTTTPGAANFYVVYTSIG